MKVGKVRVVVKVRGGGRRLRNWQSPRFSPPPAHPGACVTGSDRPPLTFSTTKNSPNHVGVEVWRGRRLRISVRIYYRICYRNYYRKFRPLQLGKCPQGYSVEKVRGGRCLRDWHGWPVDLGQGWVPA